tara:strand:+ start:346 stop:624 length:279 start_codon:yes stop_codon:yes gene_type:complete
MEGKGVIAFGVGFSRVYVRRVMNRGVNLIFLIPTRTDSSALADTMSSFSRYKRRKGRKFGKKSFDQVSDAMRDMEYSSIGEARRNILDTRFR